MPRRVRATLAFLGLAFAAVLTSLLLDAQPSPAQDSRSTTLSVAKAVDRHCYARPVDAAGADSITAPGLSLDGAEYGVVTARLDGPAGSDWDLAVFDGAGEVVAASTSSGAGEVASGYVLEPGELTVQACRIAGRGREAALRVETAPVAETAVVKSSLATVETPRPIDKQTVQELGLDLTEHAGEDSISVVLHGAKDREALERAGLEYEIDVSNLDQQSAHQRAAEAEFAAETQRSSLPSGQNTYRRLFDYTQEMKDLAKNNPSLVRPLTLKNKTFEGREVEGIEITTDPDNLRDGKPVFMQLGVHHAREWPSGEHAMEYAYELIKGYKAGNQRIKRLVERTRTIIVPIVNPDGFNASREAGEQQGSGNGEDGTFYEATATSVNEYRRKNCRVVDQSQMGSCQTPAFGVASIGVDPNRNYGGFWGGAGASDVPAEEDYRGPGPFSEPETKNIRDLISGRQVTVVITNHTFSNLVIRPPSLASDPLPPDEPIYKALGDAMAQENGYVSQRGWELYDTSGGLEDWSYYATGGLGFTFEIYCNHVTTPIDPRCSGNFHPTFPKTIAEYEGGAGSDAPPGGGGNRGAYLLAHEAALDASKHSVLEGEAPPGAVLTLEKSFMTPTRNEAQPEFRDRLETELKVPDSGNYDWHINPSTRPLVAQTRGRPTQGPPSGPVTPIPPAGTNATTTAPGCLEFETTDPACWNDHAFTVPDLPSDNESATVRVEWTNPVNDWDLKVFRDDDGDGRSIFTDTNGDGDTADEQDAAEVGQSGNSAPGTSESATFSEPETADGRLAPGRYVARVINYTVLTPDPYTLEVTFDGPEPFQAGTTENWRFTCSYAGEKRVSDEILIGRGERKNFDLKACGVPGQGEGGAGSRRCQGTKPTLVGSKGADKMIGTKGRDVIVGLGGKDKIRGRGGDDVICARGGKDRVSGGAGKDKIRGAAGSDRIKGAGGNDRLSGAGGRDRISGGGGNDRIKGGGGRNKLRGGGGKDRCTGSARDSRRSCE